jgi:hypothetical protein
MVVRLARLVKVTVSGPSGVRAWPMASARRCRLLSGRRRVPRQVPSTEVIGRRVLATRPVRLPAWPVTSRTFRPSGWRRHRICRSLAGSRALICGRAVAIAWHRAGGGGAGCRDRLLRCQAGCGDPPAGR